MFALNKCLMFEKDFSSKEYKIVIIISAIITRITSEIELFTALNCFAGAVKNSKTYWSYSSIRFSGGVKLIRYL